MTTVQTNPNLAYYTMTGLENATGTIGGYNGYMREYVNHEFGAELDYGFGGNQWKSVNALTLRIGREYVYGQYKYEPGTYRNFIYGLTSHNRIKEGSVLHSIDLALCYEMGSADEYKSERISTTDAETGVTSVEWRKILEYKKRFQLKKLDADLHYRLSWVDQQTITGYLGLGYTLQSVSNKYLLYTSEQKNAGSTFLAGVDIVCSTVISGWKALLTTMSATRPTCNWLMLRRTTPKLCFFQTCPTTKPITGKLILL